jgi:hypothetical protein
VSFIYGLFQASFCTYMFGWHVHEKALITSLLLLALIAIEDRRYGTLGDRKSPPPLENMCFRPASKTSSFPLLHVSLTIGLSLLPCVPCPPARLYFLLSVAGHASLFPLFPPLGPETCTKLLLHLSGSLTTYLALNYTTGYTLGWMEWLYCLGLGGLFVFADIVHPVWFAARLPFLANLAMSAYCLKGTGLCFLESYRLLQSPPKVKTE